MIVAKKISMLKIKPSHIHSNICEVILITNSLVFELLINIIPVVTSISIGFKCMDILVHI